MSASHPTATTPGDSALAMKLAREIKGEVLFDRASRGRYATDASIYQVEPLGVIVPETIDDVAAALAIAREEGIPVLPRGGGTSQCGQTVNRALVIDCSKHLRRVLSVDAANRTAPDSISLPKHSSNTRQSMDLKWPGSYSRERTASRGNCSIRANSSRWPQTPCPLTHICRRSAAHSA